MTALVLDNSVILGWCLTDEHHPLAERAIRIAMDGGGVMPGIWRYELRNALLASERRGRLTAAAVTATLADIAALPFETDRDHEEGTVLALAREHDLSVYDAAYLEVAVRRQLPFVSLDRRLNAAALAEGVAFASSEQA